MRLPGFTAEAAVDMNSGHYHTLRTVNVMESSGKVSAQLLFGIGSCMAECDPDDWACLFDCLSPF